MFSYFARRRLLCCVLVYFFINSLANQHVVADEIVSISSANLSLEFVLNQAKTNDYTLKKLAVEANAFSAEAAASDYLPDPTISLAFQNLPTDTFELDQEPMTQFRVGIKQMFPKGDTLSLQENINQQQVGLQSTKQQAYWLMRKKEVEKTWLDAWFWQKNIDLINEDRVFVSQINEFIQSLYEVGAKDQSDLIGSELELIKLEERMIKAKRDLQKNLDMLNTLSNVVLPKLSLTKELPDLSTAKIELIGSEKLISRLQQHPKIQLIAQQIDIAKERVSLSEQSLEPAFGVELGYGVRAGDNMDGSARADFFSAGVSVQYPLFTRGQQTNQISAARYRQEALEVERLEALEQARFSLQELLSQYQMTRDQRHLYELQILPTLNKQTNSALHSYQSDKGDFRMVSELFLKEQSAKVQHLRLSVDEQILLSNILYWLP